jgi:hypothetical protein
MSQQSKKLSLNKATIKNLKTKTNLKAGAVPTTVPHGNGGCPMGTGDCA